MNMREIPDESLHLMVTSPPYFNAPFDYNGLFKNYGQYLWVLNIDDMLVNGEKFSIVADAIKIFQNAGLRYRDRISWKKKSPHFQKDCHTG